MAARDAPDLKAPPRLPWPSGAFVEQGADGVFESTEMLLDDGPSEAVIHTRVLVNQDVAEGDDATDLRHFVRDLRCTAPQGSQRFADDLELALDRDRNMSSPR